MKKKTYAIALSLSLVIVLCAGLAITSKVIPQDTGMGYAYEDMHYDVIVVSGEPTGITAALAAARNGMRTLLIEQGDALGGLMTLGMLNYLDMNHGPDNEVLTQGIFMEFYSDLANGNAFDVEEAKDWLMRKCQEEPNLTVMLETEVLNPILSGNTIVGLEIRQNSDTDTKTVLSKAVIDATDNADIAAMAGVPYTLGASDYGLPSTMQAVTLVFEIQGADWQKVVAHMRDSSNTGGVYGRSAWGYAEEVINYTPAEDNIRFRGPNIAMQNNGNLLLNALIIYDVNPLDPDSYAEGMARGSREIHNIIEFMRERFIGFEDVEYAGHAQRLYVRETRHIIGEYRLTITDVMENRDFWDRVGHGSYPVDIHPSKLGEYGSVYGNPAIYSIPFRTLVPLAIDQLLVTGRCASYDSLPHGSTRVVPVSMVTGEAGGIAAAYSINNSVTFRQMTHDPEAILWVQNKITEQGGYLKEYMPPRFECMDHWSYPGLVVLRELGLAAGGYSNDYKLDAGIEKWDEKLTLRDNLQDMVNTVMRLAHERTEHLGVYRVPSYSVSLDMDAEVTVELLLLTAAQCAFVGDRDLMKENPNADDKTLDFSNAAAAWEYLIHRGILEDSDLKNFLDFQKTATNGQLMHILGALYTALVGAEEGA